MVLFAEDFGKAFIFKNLRPKIKGFFMKAGYDDVPYEMFGLLFYLSLAITYFVYILVLYPKILAAAPSSSVTLVIITFISWVIVQAVVLFLIIMYVYFSINMKIYKRTRDIEAILPEHQTLKADYHSRRHYGLR